MNKKSFLRSVTAASLVAAMFVTSSMTAFASSAKNLMGELIVSGNAAVTVNGEAANTGRTVFSSNTITTPANASATINLGKLGQVELAPNSSMSLTFDENGISGTLLNGRVKVSGANEATANIITKNGSVVAEANQAKVFTVSFDANKTSVVSEAGTVTLNEGGTAVKVGQTGSTTGGGFFGKNSTLIYALIFGGAAAAVVLIAANNNNDITLGGNSTVVSPNR